MKGVAEGMPGPTKADPPESCSQCGLGDGGGHVHWIDLVPRCTGERFVFCGVSCLREHAEEMMGE